VKWLDPAAGVDTARAMCMPSASEWLPVAPTRDVPKLCRMLCSRALIVIEQSSKSSTTYNRCSSLLGGRGRHDQHIAETLVIALSMKMRTVFSKGTAQHSLPDRDQPR